MVPSRYASPPQAARLAGGDRDGPGARDWPSQSDCGAWTTTSPRDGTYFFLICFVIVLIIFPNCLSFARLST
jgi:hypothetical protein